MDDPELYLLTLLSTGSSSGLIVGLVVIIFLLICSAMVSGSEVAYFSLGPNEIEELRNDNSKSKQTAYKLANKPKSLLATILIANNFINVAIVVLSSIVVDQLFIGSSVSLQWQFFIQVVAVTFIILLVGEIIPKVYATKNAVSLASTMALPLGFLNRLFRPLSYILISSTTFIDKRIEKRSSSLSVDSLEKALELTNEEIDDKETELLKGIISFGNKDVKQIMIPRLDVLAVDNEMSFSNLIHLINENGFSRIPVYEDNLDTILGMLYIKDLLPYLSKPDNFNWISLLRQPMFVPESKKIDDLLKEFQESKIHMAVVVDEFGGCSGIVTLEDIIEEIVGDISDEFDSEEINYSKLDDKNYVFEGKTPLIDFYRILEIEGENFEENKGEADTIAGFLMEISGKFLQKNEKVRFENYEFIVEAADRKRVKQIKVCINDEDLDD